MNSRTIKIDIPAKPTVKKATVRIGLPSRNKQEMVDGIWKYKDEAAASACVEVKGALQGAAVTQPLGPSSPTPVVPPATIPPVPVAPPAVPPTAAPIAPETVKSVGPTVPSPPTFEPPVTAQVIEKPAPVSNPVLNPPPISPPQVQIGADGKPAFVLPEPVDQGTPTDEPKLLPSPQPPTPPVVSAVLEPVLEPVVASIAEPAAALKTDQFMDVEKKEQIVALVLALISLLVTIGFLVVVMRI